MMEIIGWIVYVLLVAYPIVVLIGLFTDWYE